MQLSELYVYNDVFLRILVLFQRLIPQRLIILTKTSPAVFAILSNNAQVIKIRPMDLPYFIPDERVSVDED